MKHKQLIYPVRVVIEAWADLSIREADILISRYAQRMTQRDLAKKYSLSYERIRQIEESAIEKLEKGLNKEL